MGPAAEHPPQIFEAAPRFGSQKDVSTMRGQPRSATSELNRSDTEHFLGMNEARPEEVSKSVGVDSTQDNKEETTQCVFLGKSHIGRHATCNSWNLPRNSCSLPSFPERLIARSGKSAHLRSFQGHHDQHQRPSLVNLLKVGKHMSCVLG